MHGRGSGGPDHQDHDSSTPPREHLREIVPNAHRFRARWGRWPMKGWLRAFADEGLVRWEPAGDRLEIVPRTR
jgi:N-acetylglucosaminyl-diphospho-decaprenol L-rhamnosyltransferase